MTLKKFKKIQPGDKLPLDLKHYPPVYNQDADGIPGWTWETIKTMVPRKYWKAVDEDMRGNTCMLVNGKVINYWYDVLNSIDFVLNKKPYEWD